MLRRKHTLALLGLAILLVVGLPVAASGEDGDLFPYGKYQGSAVGSNADSKPIAVTVWLSDGGQGTVKISVSTPAVPFAFDADPAVATRTNGGFDLPISVNVGGGDNAINGSGTLRLRKVGDGWEMWGSGSGSALGKQGGGRGSASRTSQDSGLVDQFLGPIKDTFGSFTSDETVPQPTEYPEADFADAPQASDTDADDGNWFTDIVGDDVPPGEAGELFVLVLMLLLMSILGIVIW